MKKVRQRGWATGLFPLVKYQKAIEIDMSYATARLERPNIRIFRKKSCCLFSHLIKFLKFLPNPLKPTCTHTSTHTNIDVTFYVA